MIRDLDMIVVVDDDPLLLERIRINVQQEGYTVKAFQSAAEALSILAQEDPELVISDVMMPGMDGYAFKNEYVRRFPARKTPFVFLTALSSSEEVVLTPAKFRGGDPEVGRGVAVRDHLETRRGPGAEQDGTVRMVGGGQAIAPAVDRTGARGAT